MKTKPAKQKRKNNDKEAYSLQVRVTEKDLDALEDLAVLYQTEEEKKKSRKVLLKLWQQMVEQIN